MEKKKLTNKRVLMCNTGRCNHKIKITPETRPKVEISEGGVHSLPVEITGKCPRCGSDAGYVDRNAWGFANELSNMFRF